MVALCRRIVDRPVFQNAALLLLLLTGLVPPAHARAKTDTVTLKNGNEITCEIVSLQRGKLRVKTDDMGTVSIEWDKIAALTAKGLFEIEDRGGNLYYGPLETVPEKGLQVATATGLQSVPLPTVARLVYIEASFWKRLSGSIDLGAGYTKSSRLAQFNGDVSVKFTRPTFVSELNASSYIQRQENVDDTTRNSLTLAYTRVRQNRQFVLGEVSALQNRELGYDLRAGLTGAYGKYFVRSQGNELLGAGGLYVNREVPVDGETVTNLEALFIADWANFSYDFPKTDIEVKTIFILGLTDWGRYRVDVDARFDRELFNDFYLVVKGFYNFDSRPPTEEASKDDYQVSLAIGYKF
jgi:putative salt-induced outer membrane protein YdiY